MRSDFVPPKNFADWNDEDECDVTSPSYSKLWDDLSAEESYYSQVCRLHVTAECA